MAVGDTFSSQVSPKVNKIGPTHLLPSHGGPYGPTVGTQSEIDSLSGVRAPRDEKGTGRTKQGPERRIRASRDGTGSCGTNPGFNDESGPLRTNQVLRDGSGPVGPTRVPTARRIRARGTNQGPERRIRATRDGTGPRGTNKGPNDESGLLKTNQVLRSVRPTRTP